MKLKHIAIIGSLFPILFALVLFFDPHLDGSYTVFGEVTEGMEVVDNIEIAKTNRADRPIENIRILKASIH